MARSPATIKITCDRCQISSINIRLLPLTWGWDDNIVPYELNRAGWMSVDEDLCGECASRESLMAANN